jgi:hypothetical protein
VKLLILMAGPLMAQATLTISAQSSPFALPKGIQLYSAIACSPTLKTISAAQVRQAAETTGIDFQDPSVSSFLIGMATSKTPSSRALTATKWTAIALSAGAAVTAAIKAQAPTLGNAKTYTEVSAGAGALGAGLAILQPLFQNDVATQAAMTSGVQAALISDMSSLYAVAAGGCSKSMMFFGVGPSGVKTATIP